MVNNVDYKKILESPEGKALVGKAQELYQNVARNTATAEHVLKQTKELGKYLSKINELVLNPRKKELAMQEYHLKIQDYVNKNAPEALKKAGPEVINRFLQYFAGGDTYRTLEKARDENPKEALKKIFGGNPSVENYIRGQMNVEKARELVGKYLQGIKSKSYEELEKLEPKEKIKYILGEIEKSPEKEKIYGEISSVLEQSGYLPKELKQDSQDGKYLEGKANLDGAAGESQGASGEKRKKAGGLEDAVDGVKKPKEEKKGKKRKLSNQLRHIAGLPEIKNEDIPTDKEIKSFKKELKDLEKAILKEIENDRKATEETRNRRAAQTGNGNEAAATQPAEQEKN